MNKSIKDHPDVNVCQFSVLFQIKMCFATYLSNHTSSKHIYEY